MKRLPLRAREDIEALGLDLRLSRTATGAHLRDRTVTMADGDTLG